jgi:hypothetical protein
MLRARSTAKSFSGWVLRSMASDSWPSAKVTLMRLAPLTTCRLVRMVPLSTMTTPLPTPRSIVGPSALSLPSSPSVIRPTTRTTERATASKAFAEGAGRGFSSSEVRTAWSIWASVKGAGPLARRAFQSSKASTSSTTPPAHRRRSLRSAKAARRARRRGGGAGVSALVSGAAAAVTGVATLPGERPGERLYSGDLFIACFPPCPLPRPPRRRADAPWQQR